MENSNASRTEEEIEEIIRKAINDFERKNGHPLDAPLSVCELDRAKQNVLQWRSLLPRVEIFYAMKCCNESQLIKYLADLGTSFDCSTKREIETVLNLGVDPSRIVFSNTIKPVSALKYAAEKKVHLMTFDNEEELDKIKQHCPSARLLIRIQCDTSEDVLFNFGLKYGCSINDIPSLLKKAKEQKLNVVGIHFHAGSYVTNLSIFNASIQKAKQVFEMAGKLGFRFSILDIGGGFISGDNVIPFKSVADNLNAMLDKHFPEESQVRIIAEPGRFLAAPVYTWVVKIIGKRSNDSMQKGVVSEYGKKITVSPRFIYYVNDGIYGSRPYTFEDVSQLRPLGRKGICTDKTYPSLVFGPSCDPGDVVCPSISLPELDIGDWLYSTDAGAYSMSLASDFNMLPKPFFHYTSV